MDETKVIELQLSHCRYIWDKIKLNQETTDRYFHYFLTFITTPLVVVSAIISSKSFTGQLVNLTALIALILFMIGFCFYYSTNRFRLIRIQYVLNLRIAEAKVENGLYSSRLNLLSGQSELEESVMLKKYGADFFVNLVQIITNSFWLAICTFLFMESNLFSFMFPSFFYYAIVYVSIAIFIISVILHILIRDKLLRTHEELLYNISSSKRSP